jgi:hypothetical protein
MSSFAMYSDLQALLAHEEEREERMALTTVNESLAVNYDYDDKNYNSIRSVEVDPSTLSFLQQNGSPIIKSDVPISPLLRRISDRTTAADFDAVSIWQTIRNILDRCFQPPVVGAVAGILVAMTPARGFFVDLVDRNSSAPLQWVFDGLYSVGLAAVPVNMMILGCNLSASFSQAAPTSDITIPSQDSGLLSLHTMVGIVVGKMIVLPAIGIFTGYILKNYLWHLPEEIDSSVYLVVMIVFLTPTANNVMVMVELSGSGAKEGIARVIALQYAIAPILLSLSMTVAIGVASGWSY